MNLQMEYILVEGPFCEQLKVVGWQRIEGAKDVKEFTMSPVRRDLAKVPPQPPVPEYWVP